MNRTTQALYYTGFLIIFSSAFMQEIKGVFIGIIFLLIGLIIKESTK